MDRLEFVRNQLNLLIEEIKKKIKLVSEQVANQVESAEFRTTIESEVQNKLWTVIERVCLGFTRFQTPWQRRSVDSQCS